MKQIFMTLATIPFLTFSNNIISTNNSNNIISVKPPVATNQDNTYLFNNTYHRFDRTNNLITNQSNSDHKFYSYNAKLADYLLKDGKTHAYEVLMVNNEGQLVNSIKVSDENLAQLNSTKELMNSEVQITSIKDDYNLYSNSQYSTTYFTGANNNWTYLQFGGFNSHINISHQINGNLVENNSNLSESLGLYYIAKAVRTGVINLSVANLLGDYFISKSSFNGKIKPDLCHTILNLIIKNDEIYHKINQIPLNINSKNYALNYIFDKNNLIAMYYQTWTKELNPLLNYHANITYNDKNSHGFFTSGQKRMVNWKQYAKTWDDFSQIFPSINFDPSSHINVTASGWNYFHDLSKLEIKTKNLKVNMPWIEFWPIFTPALPFAPTETITSVGLMITVTNITITLLFVAYYNGDKIHELWNVNYDININTVILKSIMD